MNDDDARWRLLMLEKINDRFTALENALNAAWRVVLLLVAIETIRIVVYIFGGGSP